MNIKNLGYTAELENYRKENGLDSLGVGRVTSEHKERYTVKNKDGEFGGEIIGNLRFTASSRSDFPAVGDWVAVSGYDTEKVLIHKVFPRKTSIERQAVGKHGDKQIIATNVDYAFIIQAVDRDFNINRIERYLTICYDSGVEPIVVLNKIDLIDENTLNQIIESVTNRANQVRTIAISNQTKAGYGKLKNLLETGKTYCLLGSSGVGKSTLTNNLSSNQPMKTDTISSSTNKGRHVTSHRELVEIENGAILIDNPGMRELGISDATTGIEMTFEKIQIAAQNCKFGDCSHTIETDCAVLELVESGEINSESYENYLKMEREKSHFEATVAEKRQKDKDFGKMIKNVKKDIKKLNSKR